jgi:SAM-dependent methyltransferase
MLHHFLLKYTTMNETPRGHNIELANMRQFSESSLNVNARARIMNEYAVPRIDFTAEEFRALILGGLKPTDRILDGGCGEGDWLLRLREEYGHEGEMVGINDSAKTFAHGQDKARRDNMQNVRFEEMDVRYLEFPDDTFDAFAERNLLYHVDDYEKALEELVRVCKYGANGIISSKGDFHQIRSWEMLARIAPRLLPPLEDQPDKSPEMPDNYYLPFDAEEAGEILAQYFEVVPGLSLTQKTIARIPASGWIDLRQSVLSHKDSFVPIPRANDILKYIDGEFKDIFDREVDEYGFFTEYIQRTFFFCRNTLRK